MHLTLHMTARCNMRCRYCYADAFHDTDPATDMTFEHIRQAIALAIEDVQKKEENESLGVIFFGGEPLLKRELIHQTIQHCEDIKEKTGQLFHFKITTNGLLLDETFLTDPLTSQVFVALSHDGMPAAHDTNRIDLQQNGTHDLLEPVIELLLKHKPYAPVLSVVSPNIVGHYADSVAYLFEKGFHYLIFSIDYGGDWTDKHLRELKRQYQRIADWYYRKTIAEEKFYFSPFEVKIASHVFPGSCKADRCELGQTQISVAPNGTLYPCVQFVGDGNDTTYAIGHVSSGIDEIARARLYAINANEKESCADCAIRERCNHFCACLNKQSIRRIDQVSPLLCAHERLIMPIADKLGEKLYKKRAPMFIQKHYNELFPLVSLAEDRTKARFDSQTTSAT